MQRSIPNQKSVKELFLYTLLYVVYESFSSIYLFLPPLFGVLFVLLINALDKDDTVSVIFISFCLVVFEADRGYILFSSVIFLIFVYKIILPRIIQNVSCYSCIKILYILLAYIGFYLANTLISNIVLLPLPGINYYIVYYIVIEFFIVSLL